MGASRDMTATDYTGLDIGDISDLDSSSEFTHAAWYQFDSTASTEATFCTKWATASTPGNMSWFIYVQGTKIDFSFASDISKVTYISDDTFASQVDTTNWFHLAFTLNMGAAPKWYVNGIVKGFTILNGFDPATFATDDGPIVFGGFKNASGLNLNGRTAYHHLYNRELSANEIFEIMYKPGSIRENMIAYQTMLGASAVSEKELFQGLTGTVIDGAEFSDGPPIAGVVL
jgi:hypothetical protein